MNGGGRPRRIDRTGLGVYVLVGLFLAVVLGILASALLDSFAVSWFGGWLPDGWTTKWYRFAIDEFDLGHLLVTTAIVGVTVTLLALLLGLPAAYALARRRFPGRGLVLLLLVLPMLVPPITYGIPLTTLLLELRLAPALPGVILANLVPALPFVVLVMTPFLEQIDPNLERAARMLGANALRRFLRILVPLVMPGLLAAGLLVLVRTLALFELTFLTSGASSQTLVVALYYSVFGAGVRPSQSIDAMAVVYMVTGLVLLLAALRFADPSGMIVRRRRE